MTLNQHKGLPNNYLHTVELVNLNSKENNKDHLTFKLIGNIKGNVPMTKNSRITVWHKLVQFQFKETKVRVCPNMICIISAITFSQRQFKSKTKSKTIAIQYI